MRMIRKVLCAAAVLVFSAVFAASAGATTYDNDIDMDYSGVLGSYYETGIPENKEQSTRVAVTPSISYSGVEKLYYYSVADIASSFRANVMDGMITGEPVNLFAPDGVSCELYHDGELYSGAMTGITEPGAYVLRVKANNGISASVLSFTIVGSATGALSGYTMPEGFSVTGVLYNGAAVSTRENYVDLTEDGDYSIGYRCNATGVAYSLRVTADHTAPELKLEALEKGKAWGPVDISDVEPGGTVAVYRNGEEEPYSRELTKSGQYELVVSDAAGNKTSYSFTIMIYFNSGSLFFVLAVAVILAGVAAYVLIARKKLRVR